MNEAGETPRDVAERQAAPLKDVPYGNVFYPVALYGLTGLYAFLNGRRIRKQLPVSANPFTGHLGRSAPVVEGLVQNLSTVAQGLLNPPFKSGPGLERLWKVGAGFLFIGANLYLGSEHFQTVLAEHPSLVTTLGVTLAALLSAERKSQEILPVEPPAPTPT
jgi:hypothetical protein